jgi:flagellar hook-basal body complex protein FliE
VCLALGIVCDEISATALSLMDVNDGPRTLAVYKSDKGYSPRVEVRFTGEYPQVWWIGESALGGENAAYLISPYSSRFTGSPRSWTRTQFVSYLVELARAKFANDTVSFLNLIPQETSASTETTAAAKLDFDSFMRLVNTAHNAATKHTKTSKNKIVDFVKGKSSGVYDVGIDIAKDAVHYLSTKSNLFKFKQLTELVEWLSKADIEIGPVLCKEFQDPKIWKHLPPDWEDDPVFCTATQKREYYQDKTEGSVESKLKEILDASNDGKSPEEAVNDEAHKGEWGEALHAALSSAALPLPYLSLVEKADYREKIAPWSMIRRQVVANEVPKDNPASVEDAIVAWLDAAHLITALYKTDDEVMRELLKGKVRAFAQRTVCNPAWVGHVCESVVASGELDRAKALQSEFDMWLLQALSPAVASSHLPLSPHAYNMGRKDERLYNGVFGSWMKALKDAASERREHSIQSLSQALNIFYKEVVSDWQKNDMLEGYEPRIPSINSIMASAERGDKGGLFKALVADVESEVGSKIPYEVKAKVLQGPAFNTVFREIRFQSFK